MTFEAVSDAETELGPGLLVAHSGGEPLTLADLESRVDEIAVELELVDRLSDS